MHHLSHSLHRVSSRVIPYALLFRLIWFLLAPGWGSVSLFDCVSLAHVFALLCLSVKPRAFFVINVCLCVHPHQPMSTARCWSRRTGASGGRCCGRRGAD